MARTGPVTKDTSTVALGLAQVRVATAATYIMNPNAALTSTNSIGVLANTKFSGNTDWLKLESGYPLLEDYVVPIREAAALECAFMEITPYNMALALGIDPTAGGYATVHSGEVFLGGRTSPAYVRMEAVYTYPNGTNTMTIMFPRAQVSAAIEMELQMEDWSNVPIKFEAKRADSEVTGGNAVWNAKPLGGIQWK